MNAYIGSIDTHVKNNQTDAVPSWMKAAINLDRDT
jgi:hypothetical protein